MPRQLLLVLFVALAAAGWGTVAAAATTDALYLQPGRLIEAGGHRLNLVCAGAGSPTVIFDAGLEDWSPSWSKVQPAIAASTRACSYDRAGNGWSAPGSPPRTSMRIVSELHELLANAGEKPPFIVVGHSFGGFNMRLFADRYLDDVAGIVLVDSSHEDQDAMIAAAMPGADREWNAMLAGLRTCEALAETGRLAQLPKARRECTGQFFRGLPERTFSARLNAVLLRQALAAKQYAASLSEAQAFRTLSADEVRRARRSYGSVPLRILTGTHHFIDTPATSAATRRGQARFEHGWKALQRSWLSLSTNSRQTLALRSSHYVQLDEPGLVIAAIREELALARAQARAPRTGR